MQPNPHLDSGINPKHTPTAFFVGDLWLAERIGMSAATIRAQRFRRRHGLPHWLDLDAVMIGSKPRYKLSEALAWLERQSSHERRVPDRDQEVAQP